MKKLILIAVLVSALTALLAGTALAAGPATPTAQGFGPGSGMQAWSSGQATPGSDHPCGLAAGSAGMARRGGMPSWAGQPEEVTELLGMTAEEIRAEQQAGSSLAQIAASKGISEETLISTVLEARKANLAQLVANGKITQAQMDLMVEHIQTQVKTMVERTNVDPAFGRAKGAQSRGQAGPAGMMRGGRGANR